MLVILTNLLTNKQVEFKEADKYVKSVDKYAEFFRNEKQGVMYLTRVYLFKKDIEYGQHYRIFEDKNGKLYESTYTGEYKELVSYFKYYKNVDGRQMEFDFEDMNEEVEENL